MGELDPDEERREPDKTAEQALWATEQAYREALVKRGRLRTAAASLRKLRQDNHLAERMRRAMEGDK